MSGTNEAHQKVLDGLDASMQSPAWQEMMAANARAEREHNAFLAHQRQLGPSVASVALVEDRMSKDTRMRELMLEEGLEEKWLSPWSPVWGDEQCAIRDRAERRFRDELDAIRPHVAGALQEKTVPEARRALEAVREERDDLVAAEDRARQAMMANEQRLAATEGLADRVTQHRVAALKAGASTKLPSSLALEMEERAELQRDYELSARDHHSIAGERRAADAKVAEAERALSRAVGQTVRQDYEAKIAALEFHLAAATDIAGAIYGYSFASFPNCGRIDSPAITAALQRVPQLVNLAAAARQERVAEVLNEHARRRDDPNFGDDEA